MGDRLGRIKANPLVQELGSVPGRKRFHSHHGGGTLRTTKACGRTGSVARSSGRLGMMHQQSLTERQKGGAVTVSQEAEEANADKAAGQDMEQEAAQVFLCR